MLPSIQVNQRAFYTQIFQLPAFLNSLSQDPVKHIKELALSIFSKMSELFKAFNNQTNEINIKTIAMVSCLSLVALLVISMLRRRDIRSRNGSVEEN